eukprot:TRINITY_DN5876_c0_g1_i2.p1 TRINITY_DN5876_c0_g1~~TRINITY_DN5876_c0_g1_i2.p1  ORF type:complete len:173 (+),score=40.51 TRINITY_DN5876_c0_g1_i2:77-595(+)
MAAAKAEAKAPCLIHPDALVCSDAKFVGTGCIRVAEGTVIHPSCTVNAKSGPIEIGKYNVIEEQVEIINPNTTPLVIGSHNLFEVGAKLVGGGKIGNANVFECRSVIGKGCQIGDGNLLQVHVELKEGEKLENDMVVTKALCCYIELINAKKIKNKRGSLIFTSRDWCHGGA